MKVMTTDTAIAKPEGDWRLVVGWEDLYEVSADGRVWSNALRYGSRGRLLTPTLSGGGDGDGGRYLSVTLCRSGQRKTVKVHLLMLEAFAGPCPPGHEGRHLDGDNLGNRISNLVWGTHSENINDQVRHGTHNQSRKQNCPKCDGKYKLNAEQKRICPQCVRDAAQVRLDADPERIRRLNREKAARYRARKRPRELVA